MGKGNALLGERVAVLTAHRAISGVSEMNDTVLVLRNFMQTFQKVSEAEGLELHRL